MEAKLAVLEEKIATLDLAYQELTKKLSGGDKTSEKNGEVLRVRLSLVDDLAP